MSSQVDICNMALLEVGGNAINTIDEGTKEANLCDAYWDIFVKEVLGAHTWDFAKVWVDLAEISGYTFIDDKYAYAFQLPSDYVRMAELEEDKIYYDIRGTVLLCNEETMTLGYIQLIEDSEKFTPGFVLALSSRLRASIAIPLAKKGAKAIDWFSLYVTRDLPLAKRMDAQGGNPAAKNERKHTNATDTFLDMYS